MKEYNELTARSRSGNRSDIRPRLSLTERWSFRINQPAAELLGLKKGDRVSVLHDAKAGEWYIRRSKDGLPLFANKHAALGFHSSILRRDFTAFVGAEKGGFLIASEGVNINGAVAHAILTSSR